MESGTGDGSHEWLNGCRDAYRKSSSDPSTGPDNGIPVVPRVDGWDGEGPLSCRISEHTPEQEKRRHTCVLWLRVDRCHQRKLRGFTTDPFVWREDARQCGRMALCCEPWLAPLVNVEGHDRFTANVPDRVRDVSARVPPLNFEQFLEICARLSSMSVG